MTPTNVLPAACVRANSACRPLQSLCVPSSVSQRLSSRPHFEKYSWTAPDE